MCVVPLFVSRIYRVPHYSHSMNRFNSNQLFLMMLIVDFHRILLNKTHDLAISTTRSRFTQVEVSASARVCMHSVGFVQTK